MPSEIILEVGGEGGSLTITGEWDSQGKWSFHFVRDETTARELLSAENLEGLVLFEKSESAESLEDALILLDKYPWSSLYPLQVHPDFFDTILLEVRKRGGEESESRWQRILDRNAKLKVLPNRSHKIRH